MRKRPSLGAHRIPKRWEDITPEWVNAAIARRHPKARVKTVDIVMRDDGTNRRVRLGLTYARGAGPHSLFLKSHETAHRSVHLRNGNLFNEARLFMAGVALDVEHPVVYKSILDWTNVNFLLVMEDLTQRGCDPRDATRPMTVEQVASGLRGLARLHSRYWGFSAKTHSKLRWVKTWAPTEGWQVGLGRRIPIGLERAAGMLPGQVMQYSSEQLVALWTRYVASLTTGPMTLLHGDAHIGNTYIMPSNEVGFLDWQVVRRGSWSQDVGYFLIGSLTEAECRRSERDLIEEYRTALQVPNAERPSKEQAWLSYRTTPAYGLAVWLSTLGTDGWQAKEISSALSQRYAAAFVELDTEGALASIGA
jgi:Phosphotransferase enzyme family